VAAEAESLAGVSVDLVANDRQPDRQRGDLEVGVRVKCLVRDAV
jgi:hypothetical protein